MTIKGVIFDLDGTLVDTLDDLTDAMNTALAQCGCPRRTDQECRQMIGSGLRKFAQRALPEDRQDAIDELLRVMVDYYLDHCLDKTVPYEGIVELVTVLAQKGVRQAVLTNKNQKPAELIVHQLFGVEVFDQVIGAADGRKVKPDPTSTLQIIEGWKLDRSEVLYVGDSDVDIETARNAGIGCAACVWGFRSRAQLEEAGADIFITRPDEVIRLLEIGA